MTAGRGRPIEFQRVLDGLGERKKAAGAGGEGLWRRCAEAPKTSVSAPQSILAAYDAEDSCEPAALPSPPPEMAGEFAKIREEFHVDLGAKNLRVEDLRRLRRRSALFAHPDRMPEKDRAQAEIFMAEINAAIDQAIKSRAER